MMKFVISISLCSSAAAADGRHRYDEARGGCPGLNPPAPLAWFAPGPVANVYADVDAECVDLRGFDFRRYSGGRYPRLLRWNLRGADFSGANISYVRFLDGDLRGASFDGAEMIYGALRGTVDAFTKLPPGCEPEGGVVDCWR